MHILKLFFLSILFFLLPTVVHSNPENYGTTKDSCASPEDTSGHIKIKQIDVYDIIYWMVNINLRRDTTKNKGLGPYLSIIPAVGYTLQSGITGALTTSTSFYTDIKKNKNSSITANVYYSQYHQYWMNSNSNVFIDKYKLHLFGDWRYYKFPTYTYGLGDHTSLSSALPIDYSYVRFYQFIYHEFFKNAFFGIGYNLDEYWNITERVDTGKIYTEFTRGLKGSKTRTISSGIAMDFLFDNRQNSVNTKKGTYINIQYRPNLMLLGSDINWQSMLIDVREYFKLPASSDNVLALWSYNDLTLKGEPAYLDLPTIGWDDYNNTGRGYVQGRYTGNNLLYLESEYRFHVTDNGLLGGVVFCNAESILRKLSSELHTIIPGYGLGLRIKLNKNSDTNVCVDYGFGIGGSHGFFFNLGEVF